MDEQLCEHESASRGDGVPRRVTASGPQAGSAPDYDPACGPVPLSPVPFSPVPLSPVPHSPATLDPPVPSLGLFPDDDSYFPEDDSYFPEDDSDLDAPIDWPPGDIVDWPIGHIDGAGLPVSFDGAYDVDPELLAAIFGPSVPNGPDRDPDVPDPDPDPDPGPDVPHGPRPDVPHKPDVEEPGPVFGQDEAADALPPGPVLGALAAEAVANLDRLTDDELIGVLQAARRQEALAGFQQTVAIAEFARRREAQFEAAKASGRPVGCRAGEFPGEELAAELLMSPLGAAGQIDLAVELVNRLPRTLAGMAAGLIDRDRARAIALHTMLLSAQDAAHADEVLAPAAPDKRLDQLWRKAAALEVKLAPEAVLARKERARREDQRVEAHREASGNASLSGRELDTTEAMASDAYIKAMAVRLRNSGLVDGTMGQIRARVMLDLTQGRDPLDRIQPAPSDLDPHDARENEREDAPRRGPFRPGEPVPPPALINLLVPVGAVLGWPSAAPAQASGWGLLDGQETRNLVQAASKHPRTRWCATLIGPDGTAIAHACAEGRHPWAPRPPGNTRDPSDPSDPGNSKPPPGLRDGPTLQELAQLGDLLRGLDLTWEPIATHSCDHRHAEPRYTASRKLKHLLRARTETCTAPACSAQAVHCDIDHTIPYPYGATCECNTGPKCRRHHRAKQAPGWRVTQPAPGTSTWKLPSGRTHTTGPTVYDL